MRLQHRRPRKRLTVDAFDFMIENDTYKYSCDLWYREPGPENYKSVQFIKGQVQYRGEIFVVTHKAGYSGSGGMSEGAPNSVEIIRIKEVG